MSTRPGAIKNTGVLIERSWGVTNPAYGDERAACRMQRGALYQAWHTMKGEFVGENGVIYENKVSAPEGVTVIPGRKMIALALEHCKICPLQWDCVSASVRAGEYVGTWGVVLDDLIWLKGFFLAEELIEKAREHNVPVQVAVRSARELAGS